jgi:hypothetical protein
MKQCAGASTNENVNAKVRIRGRRSERVREGGGDMMDGVTQGPEEPRYHRGESKHNEEEINEVWRLPDQARDV